MKRQRIRKLLLLVSLLLFPATFFYFSPVVIIEGAVHGIIGGSAIIFAAMFVGGIFFGRLFCAFVCPGGGLQECVFHFNDKAPKQGKRNLIKYFIWPLWLGVILFFYAVNLRVLRLDFFYQTVYGVSVSSVGVLIIYYIVALVLLLPALIAGKRATCLYFCWMAPFMIIGEKLGRKLRLPGLYITADGGACNSCKLCNRSCPMSVDVASMVEKGRVDSPECIQCGSCADTCPKKALHYRMGR